ncbi:MAG: hypothetical protein GYB64_09850 [Chloroflexi bacterium]|nr:hypothetical protein [Chloroflexota bacterium]
MKKNVLYTTVATVMVALIGLFAYSQVRVAHAAGISFAAFSCDPDTDQISGLVSARLDDLIGQPYVVTLQVQWPTGSKVLSSGGIAAGSPEFLAFSTTAGIDVEFGDTINLDAKLFGPGGNELSRIAISFQCGIDELTTGGFNPFVKPLPGADPALFPAYNGVVPCGVFDVNGHGFKIASIVDFPGCAPFAPNLTVACLNSEGTFIPDNISNVVSTVDEVNFTSGQHGTCAMFPVATGE